MHTHFCFHFPHHKLNTQNFWHIAAIYELFSRHLNVIPLLRNKGKKQEKINRLLYNIFISMAHQKYWIRNPLLPLGMTANVSFYTTIHVKVHALCSRVFRYAWKKSVYQWLDTRLKMSGLGSSLPCNEAFESIDIDNPWEILFVVHPLCACANCIHILDYLYYIKRKTPWTK